MMRAVDTNVLVRLIVADDDAAVAKARAALVGRSWFVSASVLVELEWVLRHTYGLSRAQVLTALRRLSDLDHSTIERIEQTLDWYENGLDFADAVHLAAASDCDDLLTFDKGFAKRAASCAGARPVVMP